jgi:hypothetical protein
MRFDVESARSYEYRIGGTLELDFTPTIFNVPNAKFQEAGVPISPIGLHDIYIDAGAFIPTTAGALATRIIDTVGDSKGIAYIPFAAGSLTYATAKLVLPRTYNLSTITIVLEWTSQTEGSGTLEWDIAGVEVQH